MASIENRLIHLGNIPGTDVPVYHRYTVYTKDSGEQWVLRSGPSENSYIPTTGEHVSDLFGSGGFTDSGTIKFTYEKYLNADGSTPYYVLFGQTIYPADRVFNPATSSYDNRLHLTTGPLISGTDGELDSIVSDMVSRGNEINSLEIPYSAAHQNSNTSDKYVWGDLDIDYDNLEYKPIDGTGYQASSEVIRQQIENNGGILKGENAWAPATNEDFESTVNTATVAWDLVESSADWLYQHTGKPLIEFISESGKTVYDWTGDVAKAIGTTSANLFNGAKEFFSDLFGFDDNKLVAYDGDRTIQLANSGMIATDAVYVDSDGNPTSIYDSLFKTEDSNGNKVTFVREGTEVQAKDGSFVSLTGIINTIDSATSSLISFINHQIEGIFEPIFKELFSTDDSTKDANGDNSAQRLAGKILADLIQGKDITDIAQDQVNSVLIQNLLSDASKKLASVIPTGPLGADTAQFVQGTVAGAIINFAIAVAADHRMDGDEYGEAAAKALTSAALYKHFGGGAQGVAANDNFRRIAATNNKKTASL